ncbi:unnamed protein product [Cyclocybe aegerita]|uniref:F-box domain-containing protein n=1 Tax=Cyclocybe aegerita TaxID=1973307 RepID=A0A8S0VXB3_CYCAE|nr:unnamed protein product [Cyclocybe aegerita]
MSTPAHAVAQRPHTATYGLVLAKMSSQAAATYAKEWALLSNLTHTIHFDSGRSSRKEEKRPATSNSVEGPSFPRPISIMGEIPPELLGEIFKWASPIREFTASPPMSLPDDPPYAMAYGFTQTCFLWRNVALSTPEVWTSIPVVRQDINTNGFVKHVKMFLERSKDAPIHVALVTAGKSRPRSAIFSQSHRWKTAMIRMSDLPESLGLPILEALNVKCPELWLDRVCGKTNAPLLRHLVIADRPKCNFMRQGAVNELTSFVGLPMDLDVLAPYCSRLRSCTLGGQLQFQFHPPSSVLRFEVLEELRVFNINRGFFADDTCTILGYIRAPVAQRLEVEGRRRMGAIAGISELIRDICSTTLEGNSKLDYLKLHVRGICEEDMVNLYSCKSLKRLKTLELFDLPLSCLERLRSISTGVSESSTPSLPFPQLKNLFIQRFSSQDLTTLLRVQDWRSSLAGEDVERNLTIYLSYAPGRPRNWIQRHVKQFQDPKAQTLIWSEDSKLLSRGEHLAKQFVGRVPRAIDRFKVSGRPSKRKEKWCQDPYRLNEFLTHLENYEVKDPRLLEMTRLTKIMEAVKDTPLGAIPGDDVYMFQRRADEIAKRWTSLEEGIQGRRWALMEDGRTVRITAGRRTIDLE